VTRPHPNRVAPDGHIFADPARGLLFGNRGCLHRVDGTLTGRNWTTRRWISCRLAFRGRWRPFNPPGRYTGLFFLDEATALAAGHRPCAECRPVDYRAFLAAVGHPLGQVDGLDFRLHRERVDANGARRIHSHPWADLPDGAVVAHDAGWRMPHGGRLYAWTPAAWIDIGAALTLGIADVLTPPTAVAALGNGYKPLLHPSVAGIDV
jgi:hypothetical protein